MYTGSEIILFHALRLAANAEESHGRKPIFKFDWRLLRERYEHLMSAVGLAMIAVGSWIHARYGYAT